jgi:uncharacterized surface protein with fasciclin (FAS1) repeats
VIQANTSFVSVGTHNHSEEIIAMKRHLFMLTALLGSLVLVGASAAAGTRTQKHSSTQTGSGTIVQVAAASPQFSTLVSLIKKAGLVSALSNQKAHLTVFAPTNAAFATLKKNDPMTFDAVATTPSLLRKVLTYHVLATEVDATAATAAAKKNAKVKSLEGEPIALTLKNGKIILNGAATIVKANVAASNGVIHVINAVLAPPSVKVTG